MTIKEIINLDCREEENKELIQRALRKIKPLSNYSEDEEIPSEKIEKLIWKMSLKYKMRIRSIMTDIWSNDKSIIWNVYIVNEEDLSDFHVCIYGITMYEVLAKVALFMYSKRKERREE